MRPRVTQSTHWPPQPLPPRTGLPWHIIALVAVAGLAFWLVLVRGSEALLQWGGLRP